jgi:hypothetical protein
MYQISNAQLQYFINCHQEMKVKENFSTITTVILESTKTILTTVACLLETYHYPSVQGNELTGTSVVLTS